MTAPKYPIGTLFQMAEIPEEALPRFLAELPAIIAQTRSFLQAQRAFNAAFVRDLALSTVEPSWIDDDKGQASLTVRAGDEIVAQVTKPLHDSTGEDA